MTKYIKGKDGKFAGSIGDGRDKTPVSSPTVNNVSEEEEKPAPDLSRILEMQGEGPLTEPKFKGCEDLESVEKELETYAEAFTPGYIAVKVDFAGGGWQPGESGVMVAHWDTEGVTESIAGMGGESWRVGYNTEGDSTLVIHSIHHDGTDVITVTSLPEEGNGMWEALDADERTYENLLFFADLESVKRMLGTGLSLDECWNRVGDRQFYK